MLVIGPDGHGEIAFGAMQAALDIAYGADDIHFTWCGFDEMDAVQSDGSAEIRDDGSISIAFAYHDGDEACQSALNFGSVAFLMKGETARFIRHR